MNGPDLVNLNGTWVRRDVIAGVRCHWGDTAGPHYVGEVVSITGDVLAHGMAYHVPSNWRAHYDTVDEYKQATQDARDAALAEVCGWLGWDVPS